MIKHQAEYYRKWVKFHLTNCYIDRNLTLLRTFWSPYFDWIGSPFFDHGTESFKFDDGGPHGNHSHNQIHENHPLCTFTSKCPFLFQSSVFLRYI
jgi:hypothetical protein